MPTFRLWILILSGLMAFASSGMAKSQSALIGNDDFLQAQQAFQYELRDNGDGTLTLAWDIAPDYYLYRKRMSIEGADGKLGDVQFPVGTVIHDEFFGESEVFYNNAEILIDSGTASSLKLTWQGCAEAGLCYPPESATEAFNASPAGTGNPDSTPPTTHTRTATSSSSDTKVAADQSLTRQLDEDGLSWNLAIFFGLGLLLVFTPCVLPMIPILSTVIVGNEASPGRAFALSSVYVISMAVTYALLGVGAALAGSNLQAVLQAPFFIIAIASIFVLLALSMFGLHQLQLPAFVRDRLSRVSQRQQGGSLASASAMGVVAALLASPCMTAPLAGALIYIADTGNTTLGGLALLALGLGMGAPLIALATFGAGFLPRPGAWMNGVKAVFGFILLGTTIYFLERILDDTLVLALWGGLTIAAGLSLWQVVRSVSRTPALRTLTAGTSAVMTFWGGLMLIGAAAGGDRPLQPLKELSTTARAGIASEQPHAVFEDFKSVINLDRAVAEAGEQGQWTLVEFYADWCVSCKVIEQEVFADATVVSSLSDMQLLRADVTANDALDQELMRELNVVGPPTILIVGPDGQERRSQRTTGEVSAEVFLDRLIQARES
ncbi:MULTISPECIES: protein-disulfide reductase DsbD [unclassified Wenzhouxiangella]|uniref:protein-disulfide reductase DsbD n=1 Tax=unclassified Wenzhouxiangella TaxID=2613841 RepID=UPI002161FA4F|nr:MULTISPECIES: protein-disulfide reductase DsbD [unclassified Wenzhouxiangella]